MRMYYLALICSLISFQLCAQDSAREYLRDNIYKFSVNNNQKNAHYEKKATQLAYCIRDVVENGGGGLNGFNKIISFIENTIVKDYSNITNLENFLSSCNSLKKSFPMFSSALNFKKLKYLNANQAQIDERAYRLIYSILYPRVECKKLGGGAGIGAFYTLSIKGEIAYCKSSTGRHWIELRAGAGVGQGLVAFFMGHGGVDQRNSINQTLPFSIQNFTQDVYGFLLMLEKKSDWDYESNVYGVGVGGGLVQNKGKLVSYKLTPPITTDKLLKEQIMDHFNIKVEEKMECR